jgi:hypothetical protein
VQKYEAVLRTEQLTADELFADHSALIRTCPTRTRTY